jgi:hypothetical protein
MMSRQDDLDILLPKAHTENLGGKTGIGLGDVDGDVMLGPAGAVFGAVAHKIGS